ncbi:type II toxin-antitoxin system HipA family toxin [Amycolatopsis sacchari]|uniref:type II toxin-antitoxin system HipA family toxin n=1 Tax=Amycolatopsis sacchari TaxID=115433 RepID=UPI001FE8C028|nr:HipA domain-containing protein [Amycolatopsis sacchari]
MLLYGKEIGHLQQRGAYTRFYFSESYLDDPRRPVLGLFFEENPLGQRVRRLRLPSWFSNLLPEERLRRWIAAQRGVPLDREVDLLAEVGHDLPGAVEVRPEGDPEAALAWPGGEGSRPVKSGLSSFEMGATSVRFSLAGVTMKFSMVRVGERLTLPAVDERGDWIVKLPDASFASVPLNEHAMMSLAKDVGLDVPDVELRHRDELPKLPDHLWPNGEEWAYSVSRFDRGEERAPIHIEDLAQVRGFYPEQKYDSNFETVAALVYRRFDVKSLQEFARRLAFNIIIGNSDAHLKNWSLIYKDRRRPTLAPAYDLVSTAPYGFRGLGMPLQGEVDPAMLTVRNFADLDLLLGADAALSDVAAETACRVLQAWPRAEELLSGARRISAQILENVRSVTSRLL